MRIRVPTRIFVTSLARVTVPPELDSEENRKRWKLEDQQYKRGPYLIELNVRSKSGLPGAAKAFLGIHKEVSGPACTPG